MLRNTLALGVSALARLVLAVGLVACGSGQAAAPVPTRTPPPPPGPTGTPPPDYGAMRQALLLPLGALIVATRDNSATRQTHLDAFNAEADKVLPAIERDVSPNGNRLHSVIANVREAAPRRDVGALERERLALLEVR